ncbi:hypothetical protein F5J12DRAFT_835158 [Pisolithus orientalis]|uniref:uncharacterized protein n=1 Tax=Pisolithus orientalis TaxID=936130 RepID=UPI0022241A71|nr:uncharacterized protein F5J12DRAFT_835158 [Pisolithus orientalis]KAI6005153.1 hypothetical protein F5J12DRAFT_835158 [Pisolithus orientalis]
MLSSAAQSRLTIMSGLPSTLTPVESGDHDHLDPLADLVFVSTTVLRQALDLVTDILTDDDQLTKQSKSLPGSTIGKHLRHARDHFILLLDCIGGDGPYVFSYDTRSRNTPMESSLSKARIALADAISQVKAVAPLAKLDQPMTLNAITPFPQTFETTFGRELWFAGLHAVHHWSMIRVIASEQGIMLPDDFGFAPSTLVHKGSDAPLGKAKI